MKPSLPLPSFVALVCAVSVFHAESTSRAFAAAHDPHTAAPPKAAPAKPRGVTPALPASSAQTAIARSRAEVEALIAQAGTTPPEWWPKVEVKHPPTLNLTWADLGEFDKALKLAEEKAASGEPDSAYLAAGDTCRLNGRYTQALASGMK